MDSKWTGARQGRSERGARLPQPRQGPRGGAGPTLYAATEPGLEGGTFVGPGGLAEQRGHPRPVSPNRAARDEDVARRLWDVSEEMTGVQFELGAGASA